MISDFNVDPPIPLSEIEQSFMIIYICAWKPQETIDFTYPGGGGLSLHSRHEYASDRTIVK